MSSMNLFGEEPYFENWPTLEKLPTSVLNEQLLSSTSKGVLTKFEYFQDGSKYYVKTGVHHKLSNTYSTAEPIAECIAYDVGMIMGFNCAGYKLARIDGRLLEHDRDVLVCVSKDFCNPGTFFISAESFLRSFSIGPKDSLYLALKKVLPKSDSLELDKMIVFDYLFNNTDRHLNNFGFLQDESGSLSFAPLFDHGLSLFGGELDSVLKENEYNLRYFEEAKPFSRKHSKSIKLVKDLSVLDLKYDIDLTTLLRVFDIYSEYVSEFRLEQMKKLFERRFSYVQRRLSSNE